MYLFLSFCVSWFSLSCSRISAKWTNKKKQNKKTNQNQLGSTIHTICIYSAAETVMNVFCLTNHHHNRTSLFIITSLVYAMLLIVVCIAYVISDVSTHRLPVIYYEGFFTYLYGASILFLLYVFCFLLQGKFFYYAIQHNHFFLLFFFNCLSCLNDSHLLPGAQLFICCSWTWKFCCIRPRKGELKYSNAQSNVEHSQFMFLLLKRTYACFPILNRKSLLHSQANIYSALQYCKHQILHRVHRCGCCTDTVECKLAEFDESSLTSISADEIVASPYCILIRAGDTIAQYQISIISQRPPTTYRSTSVAFSIHRAHFNFCSHFIYFFFFFSYHSISELGQWHIYI